ncbi:MAG: hypothetical protein ABIE75_02620 [Candidatus Omnitrophota bacterium]
MFKERKAAILITAIIITLFLGILGIAFTSRSIQERNLATKHIESVSAFWLAEAGVSRAIDELRNDYSQCGVNIWSGSLSYLDGGYLVDAICLGQDRSVISRGFIPSAGNPRAQRIIEVSIRKEIPPNFYDNAIYSAGDIGLNGSKYSIDGDVRYAGSCDNPVNITGNVVQDLFIAPLARLDFPQLLTVSQGQGNFYDQARLDAGESFPDSFWYSAPTDPSDPTTGVPNVVYITEDLELNGDIGTIGGFFVVAGDVITSADDIQGATINGNGQIEGMIYTRGTLRINGGGGNLNINGGIWAGEEARLNGNAHITYNQDYLSAMQALGIDADAQIVSWMEQPNYYPITP